MSYEPRPGTFAERALNHLRENGETATAVLAELGGVETCHVAGMLAAPMKHRLVVAEKRNGITYWRMDTPMPKDADGDGEFVHRVISAPSSVSGQVHGKPWAPVQEECVARSFSAGIYTDGRLVLELPDGRDIVLATQHTRALVDFLEKALVGGAA